MKHYFEKVKELGHKGIAELRTFDADAAKFETADREELNQRLITEDGFRERARKRAADRKAIYDRYASELEKAKAEFNAKVDEYMMPSAGYFHPDDAEILKHFTLTPGEFERMAQKYTGNPTMLRLLDDYRREKSIDTDWRFQGADAKKEVFASACSSALSAMGMKDRFEPDREGRCTRSVYSSYHRLQEADPDALPVPESEPVDTPMRIF